MRRFWYWGGWTFMALYMTSSDVAQYRADWRTHLPGNLFQYLLWGAVALGADELVRRVPLRGRRAWLLHAGASLAATSAVLIPTHFVFRALFHWAKPGAYAGLSEWQLLGVSFHQQFHNNLLIYWAAVGTFLALDTREKAHLERLRAAQLESQLGQAQVQALRMQLHPHFLFNTLNAIASLIHSDPDAADRMLARLSGFLRLTLELPPEPEHSLRQELAFAQSYLAIEQARFRDRLQVAWDVDETLLDAAVPVLLLQPLVENALCHGVAPRETGGSIEVRAFQQGGRLCLSVTDDGPGCAPERMGAGIGTANTQARLQRLFGEDQRFAMVAAPGGGTAAQIEVPLRWTEQGDRLRPERAS